MIEMEMNAREIDDSDDREMIVEMNDREMTVMIDRDGNGYYREMTVMIER